MIFDTEKVYVGPPAVPFTPFNSVHSGKMAAASAWLPLLYDTLVLGLTLYRTLGPVRNKTAGKIARVLLRDGMLYYRSASPSVPPPRRALKLSPPSTASSSASTWC